MSITKPHKQQAFELKGSVLTVMVLQIRDPAPETLYPQLIRKIEPGRAFFAGAPVIVELSGMEEEQQDVFNCQGIADLLREQGLVPVAVRGAINSLHKQAREAGMGLLAAIKGEKKVDLVDTDDQPKQEEKQSLAAEETKDNDGDQLHTSPVVEGGDKQAAKTLVIRQPVRSGQQIMAPNGDVIVLSSVNAGAEVLAAGNIHVYGALRGRAMAGINGDMSSRIFSMQCNPELVAVAGEYLVNEMLATDVINRSVIIAREGDSLQFTPIG